MIEQVLDIHPKDLNIVFDLNGRGLHLDPIITLKIFSWSILEFYVLFKPPSHIKNVTQVWPSLL